MLKHSPTSYFLLNLTDLGAASLNPPQMFPENSRCSAFHFSGVTIIRRKDPFLKNGYLRVSTQYIGWVLILLKSYSKLNVEFEQSHLSHMAWKRLQLLKYLGHLCILHCTGEWRWKSEPWRTHCAWLGAIPLMQEQSINSSKKKTLHKSTWSCAWNVCFNS